MKGRPSTTKERIEWLVEWAKKTPNSGVGAAREAVREHFGISLGTGAINEVIKHARVDAGLPPLQRQRRGATSDLFLGTESPIAVRRGLREIVKELRATGLRHLDTDKMMVALRELHAMDVRHLDIGKDEDDFEAQVVGRSLTRRPSTE